MMKKIETPQPGVCSFGHELHTPHNGMIINIITLNNQPYLLVTLNNEKARVYELIKQIQI